MSRLVLIFWCRASSPQVSGCCAGAWAGDASWRYWRAARSGRHGGRAGPCHDDTSRPGAVRSCQCFWLAPCAKLSRAFGHPDHAGSLGEVHTLIQQLNIVGASCLAHRTPGRIDRAPILVLRHPFLPERQMPQPPLEPNRSFKPFEVDWILFTLFYWFLG